MGPLRELANDRLGIDFFPALFLGSQLLFFLLGPTLIVLTARAQIERTLKKFLILTGSAAVGIPVSAVLHNLVYGAFIKLFGENFWDRIGLGDEPFFFLITVIICPLAFIVGTIVSIILMIQRKRHGAKIV